MPFEGRKHSSSARHAGSQFSSRSARSRRTARAKSSYAQSRHSQSHSIRNPIAQSLAPKSPTISRRHFLFGAAGAAAVAVAGAGIYAVASREPEPESDLIGSDGSITTLEVPTDAVFSSDDCEVIEDPNLVMELAATVELPYGSLVWANDDAIAACLLPTETATPLAQIGLVSLNSGTYETVLENAVGQDEGFDIYDVRANSHGVIWTEANILERAWRVFSATTDGQTLGEIVQVDEGTSDWEMPTLAAVDSYGFWQVMPRTDGEAAKERSLLKRVVFGTPDAIEMYSSNGRMATAPYPTPGGIVISPRAEESPSHYQLTRLDVTTGDVTDKLVLPSSMRPYEVGYGKNGFSFAFEAIYDYGEGISNLGTYTPASPMAATDIVINAGSVPTSAAPDGNAGDAGSNGSGKSTGDGSAASSPTFSGPSASERTEAYSQVPWFRYALDPSAASSPAWCGDWFIVKGRTQVSGINLDTRKRFAFQGSNGADDFGDYLASSGSGYYVVTYADIDYTPLEGSNQRYCNVRVWKPVSTTE